MSFPSSHECFGKILALIPDYGAARFFRIIGHTPQRAILEDVPGIYENTPHGGSATIDSAWLSAHPLPQPVKRTPSGCKRGKMELTEEGGFCCRITDGLSDDYAFEVKPENMDECYTWYASY